VARGPNLAREDQTIGPRGRGKMLKKFITFFFNINFQTKLDSETRNFNDDCILKYLFIILPTLPNLKPKCLL